AGKFQLFSSPRTTSLSWRSKPNVSDALPTCERRTPDKQSSKQSGAPWAWPARGDCHEMPLLRQNLRRKSPLLSLLRRPSADLPAPESAVGDFLDRSGNDHCFPADEVRQPARKTRPQNDQDSET